MLTAITRRYHFEAAHFLPFVAEDHRCRRMHGHNYEIVVWATRNTSNDLDQRGFVVDFAELDALVLPLVGKVDHRCLNDIEGLENPTAELIGHWFMRQLSQLNEVSVTAIHVYETKDCCAIVQK